MSFNWSCGTGRGLLKMNNTLIIHMNGLPDDISLCEKLIHEQRVYFFVMLDLVGVRFPENEAAEETTVSF